MGHRQIVNAKIAKYAKMCQVDEDRKEGNGGRHYPDDEYKRDVCGLFQAAS
jgi:hypothetical protein